MAHQTAFNPSNQPLVVDEEGRTIGGGEWGTVNTTDPVGKALLKSGALVEVVRPEASAINPDAQEAFDRTEDIEARAEAAQGLDKDTLQGTAVKAGLIEEGEKVGVQALREVVAENVEVSLPKKSTNRKREA